MTSTRQRNLLKTVPGLLISAFFLWYTFRGIHFAEIRALRLPRPAWLLGVLLFTAASYTLRCVRWYSMLRPIGARFTTCARVLMTSLAANNILPLRIGDIMRCFTYAGDLGASPSVILSTVLLEKLLDIFTLALLFTLTMGAIANHTYRLAAQISLGISGAGLLVLLLGARHLEPPIRAFFARHAGNARLAKLETWILLALDALNRIGTAGSLLLLVQSAVIWACEGLIYVSALLALGLVVDRIAPWLAVSFANLSYMIPSSPGAIGPFELAVKTSLTAHGADPSAAAIFGLALHAWLLLSVTGAGGLIFLLHRLQTPPHKPLLEDVHALPADLP